MPKYLTGGQLAECQRSGQKCLASQLVRDGRNPQLLVLPEWADEAHPQERPYLPNDTEGRARCPVAPDQGFDVPPVLTAVQDGDVALTWTQADTIGPRVESYTVYRAAGAGAYVALDTQEVDFGNGVDDTPVHPLSYTDTTAAPDTLYHYRVDAGTDDGRALSSNIEDVTTAPATWESVLQITEDLGPQSQSYGFIRDVAVGDEIAAVFPDDFGTLGGVFGGVLSGDSHGREVIAMIVRDTTLVLLGLAGSSTADLPQTLTISTSGGEQTLDLADQVAQDVGGDGNLYIYWNTLNTDIGTAFTGPQTVTLTGNL